MIMQTLITLIKNISNFFKDIFNLINFFLKKKNHDICFFNEKKYTIKYLEYFIKKKCKKKKIIILSFDKINFSNSNCIILYLQTNFFREFFFLTTNFKFLYATTPNLNSSLFKKSLRKKTKYIYIQHSPVSLLKAYHEKAFLEFDAIQVINTYQYNEVKILNEMNKKKIKPFKSRYHFLESIRKKNELKKDVLIAPTWKTDFYKMNYHLTLINYFKKNNISYVLRPHPMSVIKKEISLYELNKNQIEYDLDSELNINKYLNLISNWSGIFIEFALVNKRMPYHINTSKKYLNNIDYNNYETIEEFATRSIAHTLDISKIDTINFKDQTLIKKSEEENINSFYNDLFYNDIKRQN